MTKRNPEFGGVRPNAGFALAALLIGFLFAGVQLRGQQMAPITGDSRTGGQQPYSGRGDASALLHTGGAQPVSADLAKLNLSPGFLVSLTVLDEPDLDGSFRVDQKGNLGLPVLGSVHVSGLTMTEASVLIRQKLLDDKILKDPQVTLNLLEYTAPQVTILGEVSSPGKYPLLVPHSLVDVLALAGGLTPVAGNEVEITRSGEDTAVPVLVSYSRESTAKSVAEVVVNPGDTVRVKRAGVVYVLGAVMRPGGYVMQEEGTLNVLQALSLASGASPIAASGDLHILRPNDDGSVIDIPLSYKRLMRGQTAPILLQAKDVVYVPSSKFKSAFANTSSILSAAASASIYTVR